MSRLLASTLLVAAVGCAGTPAGELAQPPAFEPEGQTKCGVVASPDKPLIIEWPAADRAALEAQRARGLAVVRYVGCEMEVLRDCRVEGAYDYLAVTPKEENVAIVDEDDLYASIPVHAASFEGALERSGRLDVSMTIVGVYEAAQRPTRGDLVGSCASATHVIRAFTVGAFEFSAAGRAEVGAGVDVAGAGVGASSKASRELLRKDGDRAACASGTDTAAPPFACSALLRVEVSAIGEPPPAPLTDGGTTAPTPSPTPPADRPSLIEGLQPRE